MSGAVIPLLAVGVLVYGLTKKVDVYAAFAEGAAEGLPVLLQILPYLAAMLIAVRLLREGGVFAFLADVLSPLCETVGMDGEVMPLVLIRPFSGSAAMAMLKEIFSAQGPDSRAGMTASILMGSSETIFYEVALLFGAVGAKKTRFAIPVALAAGAVSAGLAVAFGNAAG